MKKLKDFMKKQNCQNLNEHLDMPKMFNKILTFINGCHLKRLPP